MNEIDELNNRLDSSEEIVDSLIRKIDELEKREIKNPDYTLHFEALKKIFEVFFVKYTGESTELRAAVSKLDINYPAEQIQSILREMTPVVEEIRKSLPVKIQHRFDLNTRGWIIAGIILLTVTAISTGLCGYLWTENSRLRANDIRFRMIRQVYPVQANWADKYYSLNPEGMKDTTIKLEEEALERAAVQDRKEQAERELKEANRQLKKNR